MYYLHKRKPQVRKDYPVMACQTIEEAWMNAYQNRFYFDDIQVMDKHQQPYISFIKGEMVVAEGQVLQKEHAFLSEFIEEQKTNNHKTYTYLFQNEWSSTELTTKRRGKSL